MATKLQQVKEIIEKYGVFSLNDEQLISAVTETEARLEKGTEDFYKIVASSKSAKEISHRTGLTNTQATKLLLAVEVGKRFCEAQAFENLRFEDSASVAEYLMPMLKNLQEEHFVVICLNGKNKLIRKCVVTKGTFFNTLVHPREVFKEAIVNNSASIIVAHNHPSGTPLPSEDDKEITKNLVRSGNVLQIPVLDHIIIGSGTYYSFRENELI